MSLKNKFRLKIETTETLVSLFELVINYPHFYKLYKTEVRNKASQIMDEMQNDPRVVTVPPIQFLMENVDYTDPDMISLGKYIADQYIYKSGYKKNYPFPYMNMELVGDYNLHWFILLVTYNTLFMNRIDDTDDIHYFGNYVIANYDGIIECLWPHIAGKEIAIAYMKKLEVISDDNDVYYELANRLINMSAEQFTNSVIDRFCRYFKDEECCAYALRSILSAVRDGKCSKDNDKLLLAIAATLSNDDLYDKEISDEIKTVFVSEALSVSDMYDDIDLIDSICESLRSVPYSELANKYERIMAEAALEAITKTGKDDRESQNVQSTSKKTRTSVNLSEKENKVYRAYKNYKDNEEKIDAQATKAISSLAKKASGTDEADIRREIVEGKDYSVISVLKQVLGTVAMFNISKVHTLLYLTVRYALKKKVTTAEKKKILKELEGELEIINEKIDDAKGDGNRQAKYALMRNKQELETAIAKIRYGLEKDSRSAETAKGLLKKRREQ